MRLKTVVIVVVVLLAVALALFSLTQVDNAPVVARPNMAARPGLATIELSARATAEAAQRTAQAASVQQTAIAATSTAGANNLVAEAQAGLIATQSALEIERQAALAVYDAALYTGAITQQAADLTATADVRATAGAATATAYHYTMRRAETKLEMSLIWGYVGLVGTVTLLLIAAGGALYFLNQVMLNRAKRASFFPRDGVFVNGTGNGPTTYIDPLRQFAGAATVDAAGNVTTPIQATPDEQAEIVKQDNVVRAIAALPGLKENEREQLIGILPAQLGAGGEVLPYKIYSGGVEQLPAETRRRLEEAWRAGLLGSGESE